MARQLASKHQRKLLSQLTALLKEFEKGLIDRDMRRRVQALVPSFHALRKLGSSLLVANKKSARDRICTYFRRYVRTVINGHELLVIAGIQDYPRRIRELRVQFGWQIISGIRFKQIASDSAEEAKSIHKFLGVSPFDIKPYQYVLISRKVDTAAAEKWKVMNSIRRQSGSPQDRMLRLLKHYLGKPVSGEDLAYVAKTGKEWARRVRELRTQRGWSISTRMSGQPELAVGLYVLEHAYQTREHDRKIKDDVRVAVLERDNYSCVYCGWGPSKAKVGDRRRFLELHHIREHFRKGANTEQNLVTLCNVHHDVIHNPKSSRYRQVTACMDSC